MLKRAAWLVILGGLVGAARPVAAADPAALADLQVRFQAGLDELCKKYQLPGVTAAYALPDGTVETFASGLADKESGAAMTPSTRMLAGSVGKTFVAATVVALAQDGKLSLDDKVEKWLGHEPWFADLPNGPEITVRHLLMHRSGLADHVNNLQFALAVRQKIAAEGADPDFYFQPQELVAFVLKRKPLFPPGQGYAYTDTGYILLGLVIERAGGGPYYEQLQKRLLGPLRLGLTEPANKRDLANLAAGYLAAKNPLGLPPKTLVDGQLRFNPANEWTGGGLVSNPGDLVRWAKALYEGRALARPYVDELVAIDPADKDKPLAYGLGVFVSQDAMGTSYGHGGWFPGYLTYVAYYPAERVAVSAQVNTDVNEALLGDVKQLTYDVLKTVGKTR
jgi:D-alanyl-D-alanine carboxypeptidase